ncbi:MAG: NHL repeat-containing protein [Candidatus ainarchaeum sp.]|nr:NHL repeat-containing protein [Candidatus ainarchaeum sp.]
MKKTLALFIFFNSLFALYQFDFQLSGQKYINISGQYENSGPNMMFYYNGIVEIADSGVPGIIKYDTSDGSLSRLSSSIDSPVALYVDPDGRTYIADESAGLMRCWSCRNLFLDIIPTGVYVFNDTVYASDKKNDRIVVVTKSGTYVREFGSTGTLTGQFRTPMDLQFFNSTLYVADSGNGRVESFTSNFTYLNTYGSGKEGVNLLQPEGIFVDSNYVYVADPPGGRIVAYTQDGFPVFSYALNDSPTDVLVQGGKIYVSQHDSGMIFYASIHEPDPKIYVNGTLNSLQPFSLYADNALVADALGLDYNRTPASGWRNAKFAYDNGAYGEAFYAAMKLNQSNIASLNQNLDSQLNSRLTSLAQDSTSKTRIISLLGQENYSGAYSTWLASQHANVTQNNTNATNQTSNPGNQSLNNSLLLARLDAIEENMSTYRISENTSGLEHEIALAAGSQSAYDSAALMLDALEQKVNLKIYKIEAALKKANQLQQEIAKGGLFVDYTKAKGYLDSANSFAYYDPDKASSIADQGLQEVQKARSSANIIYIAVFVLLILAIGCVIALVYFKDRIIRFGKRKDQYKGFKKR